MKNFSAVIFCLSLILSGCATATSEGYTKIVDSWMGASEAKIVSAWGVPDSVYQLNETDKVFTYEESSQAILSEGVVTFSCKTYFTLRNGVIVDWKFKGNKCNA